MWALATPAELESGLEQWTKWRSWQDHCRVWGEEETSWIDHNNCCFKAITIFCLLGLTFFRLKKLTYCQCGLTLLVTWQLDLLRAKFVAYLELRRTLRYVQMSEIYIIIYRKISPLRRLCQLARSQLQICIITLHECNHLASEMWASHAYIATKTGQLCHPCFVLLGSKCMQPRV